MSKYAIFTEHHEANYRHASYVKSIAFVDDRNWSESEQVALFNTIEEARAAFNSEYRDQTESVRFIKGYPRGWSLLWDSAYIAEMDENEDGELDFVQIIDESEIGAHDIEANGDFFRFDPVNDQYTDVEEESDDAQ